MNALLVKVTDAVPVNGWYNARVVRLCIGEQGEPSFVEAGSLKVCRAPQDLAISGLVMGELVTDGFYQAIELATSSGVRAAVVL